MTSEVKLKTGGDPRSLPDYAALRDEISKLAHPGKRLVRTVLIFTESSDQLSRATDRVPGLPASPG
ncbi:hypothetical protein NEL75_26140, partial [Escherichia coli]|nr:hypothetical protein [Escherichia coli]